MASARLLGPGDVSPSGFAAKAEANPSCEFDVVVLGASAGGVTACMTVLQQLPRDFPLPVVMMLHLPPESTLPTFYMRLPFDVEWAGAGSVLRRRKLLICPPRALVELLPNGTCAVSPSDRGAMARPIDALLTSAARSFGSRALGVILSGMGGDGAIGAFELHSAGGRVLVQSEATAEYPEMPQTAIRAGAADLVLPLDRIGQVIDELVAGTPRPLAQSELDAIRHAFGDRGAVAREACNVDWARTPLGPAIGWPDHMRLLVRTALESPHAAATWWGADLIQIYNDAWGEFLGPRKHPVALGAPARTTWADNWPEMAPTLERVIARGEAVVSKDFPTLIERHGALEEMYLTFSYTPIRDASGAVVGVHNTAWDSTHNVVAERRMSALRALATRMASAGSVNEVCERAASALAAAPLDVPFALLYLHDLRQRQATLVGCAGVERGSAIAPRMLWLKDSEADAWSLARSLAGDRDDDLIVLDDLAERFAGSAPLAASANGTLAPKTAVLLPLSAGADRRRAGTLIVALNPHRSFDDGYRSFLAVAVQQINAAIGAERARAIERERLDQLAELDRIKTDFFANVSHEFRTPLTLLLAPLEDMLRERDQLRPQVAEELDVAARNARRLLRLVNGLLDFSSIESRRQLTRVELNDLPALTQDVVSAFRSAIEAAGLQLKVEIEPGLPPVPVNREMWEKVLSNLFANAFKFTFEGQIAIRMRALRLHAQIEISDTGIGIPASELPNIFKRFHRVKGARARTAEGSGIGLAIVHDLVTRMAGQITVTSEVDKGTTFTIWLPFTSRLMRDGNAANEADALASRTNDLANEASMWLADASTETADDIVAEVLGTAAQGTDADSPNSAQRGRVLVVDDNADLRRYLQRLLGARWDVQLAANGTEALETAEHDPPDVILADVMMPGMDGFELLRQLRAVARLSHTPVILLTARAGEDAAIEGLKAGADDYIAKPFSPRELIARVGGQIMLSRTRRRAEELNAFLVRFSDAVRGLSDPIAVADVACQMVVEQLSVVRAIWADADQATDESVIEAEHQMPGPVFTGRFPFAASDPLASIYRSGRSVVLEDGPSDPRLPDSMRTVLSSTGVCAALGVPVLVNGKLRAVFGVHQGTPRHWTSEEIAFVEGLAGRCWTEIERARAEAALRASEEKFRMLFESIDAERSLRGSEERYRMLST